MKFFFLTGGEERIPPQQFRDRDDLEDDITDGVAKTRRQLHTLGVNPGGDAEKVGDKAGDAALEQGAIAGHDRLLRHSHPVL